MSILEKYLNNLEHYLPEHLKEEVKEEIESSLLDQIEDRESELGRKLNEQDIAHILKKFGHPMRVSAAYLPAQRLIGGEYFPAYKQALLYSLLAIVGLTALLKLLGLASGASFAVNLFGFGFDLLGIACVVFTLVTLSFYLLDRYQVNTDKLYAWSPLQLKSRSAKLSLNRFETGFEITTYSLFLLWWNTPFPWNGGSESDSVNNILSLSSSWTDQFWAVNVIVGLALLLRFYHFITANWSKVTLVIDSLLILMTLFVIYQISQFDTLVIVDNSVPVNPAFERLLEHVDLSVYILLAFIALVSLWELLSNIRKFKMT